MTASFESIQSNPSVLHKKEEDESWYPDFLNASLSLIFDLCLHEISIFLNNTEESRYSICFRRSNMNKVWMDDLFLEAIKRRGQDLSSVTAGSDRRCLQI